MNTNSNNQIEEGHISVEGGKIWFCIRGKERKEAPLVLIHGGPGSSHDYLDNILELSYDGPIVVYDQLGCGKSDRPTDLSLWEKDRFVEELYLLLNALKQLIPSASKGFHLLGQSWGGALSVCFYNKYPENIISLILSAPLISSKRWCSDQKKYLLELPIKMQRDIDVAEEMGLQSYPDAFSSVDYQNAMMEFYKRHLCRLDPWPELLNKSFEVMNSQQYFHMWGPSEFTVSGNLKNLDCTEILKTIKIPVLLTCGRFDEATPSTMKEYEENIQNSKLVIFEDASHIHHLEKPEEYMAILLKHLNSIFE
jgi:proline iminopeptidase